MQKNKNQLKLYKDGVCARLKNKRIIVRDSDDGEGYFVELFHAEKQPINDGKWCTTKAIRNKVKFTKLKLSEEAMDAILTCYINLKQIKNNAKTITTGS